MDELSDYLQKAETYERIAREVPDHEIKMYLLDKASTYRHKVIKRTKELSVKPREWNMLATPQRRIECPFRTLTSIASWTTACTASPSPPVAPAVAMLATPATPLMAAEMSAPDGLPIVARCMPSIEAA